MSWVEFAPTSFFCVSYFFPRWFKPTPFQRPPVLHLCGCKLFGSFSWWKAPMVMGLVTLLSPWKPAISGESPSEYSIAENICSCHEHKTCLKTHLPFLSARRKIWKTEKTGDRQIIKLCLCVCVCEIDGTAKVASCSIIDVGVPHWTWKGADRVAFERISHSLACSFHRENDITHFTFSSAQHAPPQTCYYYYSQQWLAIYWLHSGSRSLWSLKLASDYFNSCDLTRD